MVVEVFRIFMTVQVVGHFIFYSEKVRQKNGDTQPTRVNSNPYLYIIVRTPWVLNLFDGGE